MFIVTAAFKSPHALVVCEATRKLWNSSKKTHPQCARKMTDKLFANNTFWQVALKQWRCVFLAPYQPLLKLAFLFQICACFCITDKIPYSASNGPEKKGPTRLSPWVVLWTTQDFGFCAALLFTLLTQTSLVVFTFSCIRTTAVFSYARHATYPEFVAWQNVMLCSVNTRHNMRFYRRWV